MNPDTVRTLNAIKQNGYWRKGTAMGEGGWDEVYKFAQKWNRYYLNNLDTDEESICYIRAKDDKTAIRAFSKMFRIDQFAHEIIEERRTYRLVNEN